MVMFGVYVCSSQLFYSAYLMNCEYPLRYGITGNYEERQLHDLHTHTHTHTHTHIHTHTTQRLTLSATSMLALFSKRSAMIAVCPNVAAIRRGVMTNCEVSYKLNINTLGKRLLEGTLNVIIKMGIRHSVAFN